MNEIILASNIAVTLAIGVITFLIAYSSSNRIEDELIAEFARRVRFVIAVLVMFVIYWGSYTYAWTDVPLARYPLYLALIFIFLYLMWMVMSFQKIAEKFGMSEDSKWDKMEKEEFGNSS
jgi:Ca2+/Na+ antiporter